MPILLGKSYISVLLLERGEENVHYFDAALERIRNPRFEVNSCTTLQDAKKQCSIQPPDVLMVGLPLPDADIQTIFDTFSRDFADLPVLILTDRDCPDLAKSAVAAGAQDYLIKSKVKPESIARAIHYAVERKSAQISMNAAARHAIQAQDRLQLALEASDIGVFSYDFATGVMHFDNRLSEMFELPPESADAGTAMSKIFESDRRAVIAAIESAIRTRQPFKCRFRVRTAAGGARHIFVVGQANYNVADEQSSITGVCRDVTSEMNQEEHAKRLALLEQKDEFVAMLAHDLRTPIIAVNRLAQYLLENGDRTPTEDRERLLSQMQASTKWTMLMINNVLDQYRYDWHDEPIAVQQMSVESSITRCADELSQLADAQELQLTCEADADTAAMADPLALHRILVNLVSNAIKYTPNGGEIKIKCWQDGHGTKIAVSDTGPGIAPELKSRLFERFAQGKRYREMGLGLGLKLSQQLALAMGGRIECKSRVGEGSEFIVSLPGVPKAAPLARLRPDQMPVAVER